MGRKYIYIASVVSLLLAAAFIPTFSFAGVSTAPSFRNERSALSSGGRRSASSQFSSASSMEPVASSSQTSASYLARAGLMPGYFFPSAVGNLQASACTPGEFVLSWRSPGNDGSAPGTHPRSYQVRMSTDPAVSPASSHYFFVRAPVAAGTVPVAGVQGSTIVMFLAGLNPGVTYYISVAATEADGMLGSIQPGTTAQVALTGASLSPLNGRTGFKESDLWWPVPSGGNALCIPVGYNVYRSTDLNTGFTKVLSTPTTTWVDTDVLAGTTYYYQVAAYNALDQEFTTSPQRVVWVRTAPSLPPTAVTIAASSSSTLISWRAPDHYDFGQAFQSSTAPRFDELTGYLVWKGTSPFGPWGMLASVSSTTQQAVDPTVDPGAFYRISAINVTEESGSPYVIDPAGAGHIIGADGKSEMVIPAEAMAVMIDGGYWAASSTETMSAGGTGPQAFAVPAQSVYASLRFDLFAGTATVTGDVHFPKAARLDLSYAPVAATMASPEQTSVFYEAGDKKWLKLYGVADRANKVVRTEVFGGGTYQLRGMERTTEFNFNSSNLSNKLITPNGDNRNDVATFIADNPRNSQVTGKIFDLTGALVAQFCDTNNQPARCDWDAKANGKVVQGGVYIYQLQGDDKTFTGTVVVIK